MRTQDNHAHADCRHKKIGWLDYVILFYNVLIVRLHPYLSLNVHLPFEVAHPAIYPNLENGIRFIRFGERLKRMFHIKLYWENAPAQNYGVWDLKYGQMDWTQVPDTIDLCLDTGHVMLGAKSVPEARTRLLKLLQDRGKQVKHLHIHENDLLHDVHNPIGKVTTNDLLKTLTENRSYIFEKGFI